MLVGLLVFTGVACSSDDEASDSREYATEIRESFLSPAVVLVEKIRTVCAC